MEEYSQRCLNFYGETPVTPGECLYKGPIPIPYSTCWGLVNMPSTKEALQNFDRSDEFKFNIIHAHHNLTNTTHQVPLTKILCFLTPLNYSRNVDLPPIQRPDRVTHQRKRRVFNRENINYRNYFLVSEKPEDSLPSITEDIEYQGIDYFLNLTEEKIQYIKHHRSVLSDKLKSNYFYQGEFYHSCFENATWFYPGQEYLDMEISYTEEDKLENKMGIYYVEKNTRKHEEELVYEKIVKGKKKILLSEYFRKYNLFRYSIVFILGSRLPHQSNPENMTAHIQNEICCLYTNLILEEQLRTRIELDYFIHPICSYQSILKCSLDQNLDFSHSVIGRNYNMSRTIPHLQRILDYLYQHENIKTQHINYIISLSNSQIYRFLDKIHGDSGNTKIISILVMNLFPRLIDYLPKKIRSTFQNEKYMEYYGESSIFDRSEMLLRDTYCLLKIINLIGLSSIYSNDNKELSILVKRLLNKKYLSIPFRISGRSFYLSPEDNIENSSLQISNGQIDNTLLNKLLTTNFHVKHLILDNCSFNQNEISGISNIQELEFRNFYDTSSLIGLKLLDSESLNTLVIHNTPSRYIVRKIVREKINIKKLVIQYQNSSSPDKLFIKVGYSFKPSTIILSDCNLESINLDSPNLKHLILESNKIPIDIVRINSIKLSKLVIRNTAIASLELETQSLTTSFRYDSNRFGKYKKNTKLQVLHLELDSKFDYEKILIKFPNLKDLTLKFKTFGTVSYAKIFPKLPHLKKVSFSNCNYKILYLPQYIDYFQKKKI